MQKARVVLARQAMGGWEVDGCSGSGWDSSNNIELDRQRNKSLACRVIATDQSWRRLPVHNSMVVGGCGMWYVVCCCWGLGWCVGMEIKKERVGCPEITTHTVHMCYLGAKVMARIKCDC